VVGSRWSPAQLFWFQDTQFRTQGHVHPLYRFDRFQQLESGTAISTPEELKQRIAFERQPFSNLDAFHELKAGLVFAQQSIDAISFYGLPLYEHAQFDQIVGSRKHDDQRAGRGEHPCAFRGISPSVNRQDDIHAAILERKATIGVGHDPCQRWIAPGREPDGGYGQIDADGGNRLSCGQAAQQLARPGSQIDHHRVGWKIERPDLVDHAVDDRAADSGLPERGTRLDSRF
jgi:hypothetical protein